MARSWAASTALATITALAGHGQPAEDARAANVFLPEDFQRFSPRTALDLVREIPGFSIQGSGGGRGLGQASGNVLLDGQRISGKSTDTLDVLDQIPIARVARLELVEATTLGIPGLSGQVVNVITTGGAVSGVWEWRARLRERLEPRWGDASLSLNGETGDFNWRVGLNSNENRFGNAGPEIITDPFLNVVERRDEDLQGHEFFLEGTGGFTWSPPNGHEANLNASYAIFRFDRRQQGLRTRFDDMSDPVFRRFDRGEDEWNSEISGDYGFPLMGGSLKLIGVFRHEDSRFRGRVREINNVTGDFIEGVRLDDDFVENEAIGRAEFDVSRQEGRDWQVAVESAYNRLDAGSSLFRAETDGAEILEDRATPTLVEENRYEVSLTHSRVLGPKLSLQASLSAEYSELSSEVGMDTRSESFVRPKGYVSATWEWDADTNLTARIEREVGQLSFFDFVDSQDLNNGNDDAANRALVPDQAWLFQLVLDRQLGDFGAFEITFEHEEIEDVIDRVPLPGGGEGVGNVDSASRTQLEVSSTLRLDPFGLDGVQIDFEWDAYDSEIIDQLTGEARRLSGSNDGSWSAEVRWDIPDTDYALSIAGERGRSTQRFRLDEIQKFQASDPFVWIELEHKDLFGTNAFIRFGNLLDQTDVEDRLLFEPDRTGNFIGRQRFDRDFGYILTFGLSGSF